MDHQPRAAGKGLAGAPRPDPRQASAYAEPEPQQQLRLLRRGRRTSIPDRMTLGEMAAFAGTVVALALVVGFL
jgi:hypothetical protein